jgi:multiple antibiotic resistance protein
MFALFLSAFVTLFVIIDPPGCAPIFAGLTSGASPAQLRAMAIKAGVIATAILVVFALFGEQLLAALHIELDAFRIAGGIMLFLIALEMVFEKRTERREERSRKLQESPERPEDISVFPMAIPMIAGPGSIASAMLLTARAHGFVDTVTVLAALGLVLVILLLSLLAAGPLMRALGRNMEAMLTRLLGVLLAALAAQFVMDGVRLGLG